MSAIISECGKYRYVLRRTTGSVMSHIKPVLFIMLNPSTADASQDDPTIRKCVGFAKQWGMTHVNVVNLFAYRSTDPDVLLETDDPVGPENDKYIQEELSKSELVVCAWGSHKSAKLRSGFVKRVLLSGSLTHPKYLRMSRNTGQPYHPLYVSYYEQLKEFPL